MSVSATERAIVDAIAQHGDDLYCMLERHVAIPTGGDHVEGLDAYRSELITHLQAIGAVVELREGDARPAWLMSDAGHAIKPFPIAVARHEVAAGRPHMLIAGHIDTVHDPHGPFQTLARSDDGTIAVGPGAVDMKGGIVCALGALQALHDAGVDVNWTVVLNSDEETGSFQSERTLRELAAAHDYGIALEPALAGGELAIERMGSGQFMVEVHGVSAHVGREFEKGRSAVTALGEVLIALAALAEPANGRIVNVGPIEGGKATNIVPDYAACRGNVRYATKEAGEALGRAIDALAHPVRDGISVTVHRRFNRPAKPLTPAVEAFADLARAAAEDLGQRLPFARTGGVCDGNILQDAGLTTLDTLGIRGGNLHRTDEFIEVAALVERAQLLALLLLRLSDSEGTWIR